MGLLCYLAYYKISLLGYFVNSNIEIAIMNQFKKRLRLRMTQKGLTQVELAKLANVSQNSISKWLNGESVPSIDKALSLAKALDLSVGELIGELESQQELLEEDKRFLALPLKRKRLLLRFLDAVEIDE